jgi:hypothetical protein
VTREVFKSENGIINLCDRSKTLSGKFFEKFFCDKVIAWSLGGALQLRKKHGKTSVRVAEEC